MAVATTTAILLGLAAAGTATSAVGQVKAGNAAKATGDYNAAVAETQAKDAISRGRYDEQRFRQGVKVLIGSQRAGFAGQGVDVGVGSAVDVQADAAYLGELDALEIRNNAAREAWGYKVEAENYRRGGAQQQTASRFGAAGTVLGSGASLLQQRYGFGGGSPKPLPSRQTTPNYSTFMPGGR